MIPAAKREAVLTDLMRRPEASFDAPEVLPDEITWLGGGQRYVACAFYTSNYLSKVLRLKESLERFGLNYHLKLVPRRLTWEATTRQKPAFVGQCLESFPDHHILYLDADAIVRRSPDFLDEINSDIGLLFAPVVRDGKRYLSIAAGTLYVRNTPGGRRFAKIWQLNEPSVGPLGLDEDMIYCAFNELEGISFTALPRSYSKIFDSPGPDPVIEHFQASRKQLKLSKFVRRGRRATSIALLVAAVVITVSAIMRLLGLT
jgi:hypothetical protein